MSRTHIPNLNLQLFDIKTAASLLGISIQTTRRLIKSGQLCHKRIGDRILFSESDLKIFADSCTVEGGK